MFLDLFIAIIAFSAFLYGYTKGIIRVVFAVVAILLGGLVALRFTPAFAIFLADTFPTVAHVMPVAAVFILFVFTILLVRLVAKALEGGLKAANINVLNKMAGGLIFAIVCVVLISAIVQFIDASGLMSENAKVSSKVFPYIQDLPAKGAEWLQKISPYIKDMFDSVRELFEKQEG